jgi:hypothetical protein
MKAEQVLRGERTWSVECADSLAWLRSLPDECVSLVCYSPPYTSARLYLENGKDLGVARSAEDWVKWMADIVRECVRVCTGLVAIVVDDQTSSYRYGCAPMLLAADLHRAGFNLRRPLIYRRSGIPGSGGPDWFRCAHEWVICVTRPGKLPWSDVTACGHVPKYAPGGEMSHRLKSGGRVGCLTDGTAVVNKWNANHAPGQTTNRKKDGTRKTQHSSQFIEVEPVAGLFGEMPAELHGNAITKRKGKKVMTRERKGQHSQESTGYDPPTLANPGTVHDVKYTPDEVLAILRECGVSDETASSVIDCGAAGGGNMGSKLAHANEAPFPESLVEVLVRSFCPPGGTCLDPFSGSGTTGSVAVRWGRKFIGCDLRESQVLLSTRRIEGETPPFPGMV